MICTYVSRLRIDEAVTSRTLNVERGLSETSGRREDPQKGDAGEDVKYTGLSIHLFVSASEKDTEAAMSTPTYRRYTTAEIPLPGHYPFTTRDAARTLGKRTAPRVLCQLCVSIKREREGERR